MTSVFLIAGPPCAGKTTYATNKMTASDMIVDVDFLTKALTNKYLHNRPKSVFPFVISARDAIYKRMESKSSLENIYVTATMPKAEDREKFAEKYKASVVLLLPSKEECFERLYNDEQRTEDVHEELNQAIEKWYQDYTESDKDIIKNDSIKREVKQMPIPSPRANESQDEFISRCMGDDTMNEDYPDQEQRSGVCFSTWRNRDKSMNKQLKVPLQIKALNKREFEGYGSVFGNKDYGGDVMLPGAFKRTLAEHKNDNSFPVMFWMHNPSDVPGKWLDMQEDENGLYVKGVLADTPLGNEIHTLLGMKAVSGLSIGYQARDYDYDSEGVRLLKDVDLWETSIVSLPMNPRAQITHAKSRLSERGEYVPKDEEIAELKRDIGRFLQTKGFSRRAAMAVVADLFKGSTSVTPDDPKEADQKPSMTPDEIELNAGHSDFNKKLTLQDLDRIFKRTF